MPHKSYSQLRVVSTNPPDRTPSLPSSGPGGAVSTPAGSITPQEPRSILLRTLGAVVLAEQQEEYVIGALHNLMLVVWRTQVTTEALEKLKAAVEWMKEKFPEGRSSVHVVVEGAPLLSPQMQRGVIELMRRSDVACGAAVYLGSGFWASAHRSNATQMTMQAQQNFEFRLHQTLEELVSWLPDKHHELTGVRLRSERVLSAARAFIASV